MRELLEKMIAEHTGKDQDDVSRDIERDKILTADAAVEYGLIDAILESRKATPARRRRYRALSVRPGGAASCRHGPAAGGLAVSPSHLGARRGTFEFEQRAGPVACADRFVGNAPGPIVRSRRLWHASVTEATC